MSIHRIPTADDWRTNPQAAEAAALELAAKTSAHGDPKTAAIALALAAKLISAAAPIIGAALGGQVGALAGASIARVADHLGNASAGALDSLSAADQHLVNIAVALASDELAKRTGG